MKFNMKKIMKRANEIAKEASVKFGYPIVEFIDEAIKMAWAEAKEKNMKGSEKQVNWAESIREDLKKEIAEKITASNPILDKAIETILAIDYADYWIDFKDSGIALALKRLANGHLRYKGLGYRDQMGIDQKTGEIFYSKMSK